jgi:uncharacterized membrane protein
MSRRALAHAVVVACATLGCSLLAACAKETTLDETPCPPAGTTLTYDDFGRAFLDRNCQVCHGQPEGNRQGAPSSFDFGTLEAVHAHAARIFARAAADNTTMPPGPDDPPRAERDQLAEWLACGAP